MSDLTRNKPTGLPGPDDVASLAAQLEAYAEGLSEHERRMLALLVFQAMAPEDRMAAREGDDLLDESERRFLVELERNGS